MSLIGLLQYDSEGQGPIPYYHPTITDSSQPSKKSKANLRRRQHSIPSPDERTKPVVTKKGGESTKENKEKSQQSQNSKPNLRTRQDSIPSPDKRTKAFVTKKGAKSTKENKEESQQSKNSKANHRTRQDIIPSPDKRTKAVLTKKGGNSSKETNEESQIDKLHNILKNFQENATKCDRPHQNQEIEGKLSDLIEKLGQGLSSDVLLKKQNNDLLKEVSNILKTCETQVPSIVDAISGLKDTFKDLLEEQKEGNKIRKNVVQELQAIAVEANTARTEIGSHLSLALDAINASQKSALSALKSLGKTVRTNESSLKTEIANNTTCMQSKFIAYYIH